MNGRPGATYLLPLTDVLRLPLLEHALVVGDAVFTIDEAALN